ncbi:MAG: adenylate/guanylate cyclase domain-containing protein [Oscillatoria sp. PMC 1068.18]|nr:adenylate/guanylate cyclase domain-containing protein [Oscillatoria sp. PMC 1076.18]MEC4991065.1 adenylate/guanylate cyclase domain-containing protein [Oscillatoria sp. PMC 1068.18]
MNQAQSLPSQENILVVDDHPVNLKLLTELLSEQGYHVRVAPNGKLALQSVQANFPDLIILDLIMPEMDGYQVCKQLKANPETEHIPVIFLTAVNEAIDKVKAFTLGGVDYITKPFEEEEVLARVENHLRLRSLQLELEQRNNLLRKQEAEIRLLLIIIQKINQAEDIHSALADILPLVCLTIHWDYAEAWIPNQAQTHLQCSQSHYSRDPSFASFHHQSQKYCLNIQDSLINQIFDSKKPLWTPDIERENWQNFFRFQQAIAAGFRAAGVVPIIGENQVLAILFFFKQKPFSKNSWLIQLVSGVATQLGSFMQRKQVQDELKSQKEQTERLLLNILPRPVALRLQSNAEIIADDYADASVLFADLVGFTAFSAQKTSTELIEVLNEIFSRFDQLTEKYNLEKIKTIGDAYMVVGNLPDHNLNHASAIAQMALEMQASIADFSQKTHENFQLRIGINLGPVVAGVIGKTKFIYDLWGDTVNVASRMESSGVPGKIQVTETVYERLKEQFKFQFRGSVPIKGKGEMTTYFLVDKSNFLQNLATKFPA